jgi:hypothetical protein
MNEIVLPDLGSDNNSRVSPYIYLKGFNIETFFYCNNVDAIVHMAIIQDRDNNNSDLDRRQNFFRDTTSLTTRAHPFNDFQVGSPYDSRMTWNPINSDHYNVITHKKFVMQPKANTSLNRYWKWTKKYYPIKRRVAFDNLVDTTNWRPFYICFWWQPVNIDDYQTNAAQGGVQYRYKTDVVYKNIV